MGNRGSGSRAGRAASHMRPQRRRAVAMAALKVSAVIKIVAEAGKANPSPPVGPALGAKGVNIMSFCKEYNAKTAEKMGSVIPVEISVFEDKSFSLKLKTPPAAFLIKQAAKITKASANPKKTFVGKLTIN